MPWSELVVVNGFTLMFCLLHDPIWNCTSLFSHDRDRIIVLLKRVYSMALELPFSPGLRIYSSLQEEVLVLGHIMSLSGPARVTIDMLISP